MTPAPQGPEERIIENARRSAWYWWTSGVLAGAGIVGFAWLIVEMA